MKNRWLLSGLLMFLLGLIETKLATAQSFLFSIPLGQPGLTDDRKLVVDADGNIYIALGIQEGKLRLAVENTKYEHEAGKPEGRGVGVQNVTKRLELLYYGRYRLAINDEKHRYSIHLTLTF